MGIQIPRQPRQQPSEGNSFQSWFLDYAKEWERWWKKVSDTLHSIFIGSEDLTLSILSMAQHNARGTSTKAGTAISLTNKLGQVTVNVVVDESNEIISKAVMLRHNPRIDEIKAGTGVTLTRALGRVTLSVAAVDSDQNILANQVFGA